MNGNLTITGPMPKYQLEYLQEFSHKFGTATVLVSSQDAKTIFWL